MGVTPTDLATRSQDDEFGSIPEVGRKENADTRGANDMGWFDHSDGRETRYDPNERDAYVEDMKKRAREHEEQKKREREEKDRRKKQL